MRRATITTSSVRPAEPLREGRPLLPDRTPPPAAVRSAGCCTDRVRTVTAPRTDTEAAVLLIRPDGHLARAGDEPLGTDDPHTALTDWFGPAPARSERRRRRGQGPVSRGTLGLSRRHPLFVLRERRHWREH
ncbi:hypothetical protein [Streptomyces sp. NPDC040750]|uniref:aromatic-ring hydroxylase C-terminal domain-containing protein n=1 Tax=Streptomyces sp. NPDC040750 TaxID=3154491 RepID=UPI0033C65C0F